MARVTYPQWVIDEAKILFFTLNEAGQPSHTNEAIRKIVNELIERKSKETGFNRKLSPSTMHEWSKGWVEERRLLMTRKVTETIENKGKELAAVNQRLIDAIHYYNAEHPISASQGLKETTLAIRIQIRNTLEVLNEKDPVKRKELVENYWGTILDPNQLLRAQNQFAENMQFFIGTIQQDLLEKHEEDDIKELDRLMKLLESVNPEYRTTIECSIEEEGK